MNMILILIIAGISILAIIYLTSKVQLAAFISLFIVSIFLAVAVLPAKTIVNTLQEGFGTTMASIGFLIVFGAIIGIALDKTGGTLSIARFILSKIGEHRSAQALGITGFITGVPIFCNSGFIVLSGLCKSLSAKSRLPMPFMATVLGCSLYSVHCLIPPHPGVLAASAVFKVNIGYLIIIGTVFAIPGALAAYFWSKWLTGRHHYAPAKEIQVDNNIVHGRLPSPFLSLLPIVLPLLLIALKSLFLMIDGGQSFISRLLLLPGEPLFALSIGAATAMLLIKDRTIASVNSIISEAIEKAGPILIVTAAGGMFGMVIKATGAGEAIGKLLAGTSIGLVVPFLIATAMKTAQGSSTVAIITTASFVAPMISMLGLDSQWGRIFAMLSMGAGSMVVSHANDSYFWVVANFSDLDAGSTLKVYTSATLIMGLVVFACVWITSLFVL